MEIINVRSVLLQFVQKLQIPITRSSINDETERHPDSNTLLAISELLTNWKVPNAAYALTFEELLNVNLNIPFIAYFNTNHGEFVLVESLTESGGVISNERLNKREIGIDEFKTQYADSIIVAEKDENSGEKDYLKKRRVEIFEKIRFPFSVVGIIVILFASLFLYTPYLNSLVPQVFILTLCKTVGFGVSILLLLQSIDSNNPIIQKVCGKDNNKSCNAILSSGAAKINDCLTWSEVGFFYFSGTLLILLMDHNHPNIMRLIGLLNIICLPYTIYSIYYQWRIAKQWCTLCCIIQGVLWLECIIFLPVWEDKFRWLSPREFFASIICITLPILVWIGTKPFLSLKQEKELLAEQLRKFKYNTNVFDVMMNEEVVAALPKEEYSIIIGNREAEHVITMVSNPYCRSCSKAHKEISKWLDKREDFKLQIIFDVGDIKSYTKDPATRIVTHLMRLQFQNNDQVLENAVRDWYDQDIKDYDNWIKRYPVFNTDNVIHLLENQIRWCEMVTVASTPMIFIDRRKLKKIYQIEDLTYLI